jgi:hypothetical protein
VLKEAYLDSTSAAGIAAFEFSGDAPWLMVNRPWLMARERIWTYTMAHSCLTAQMKVSEKVKDLLISWEVRRLNETWASGNAAETKLSKNRREKRARERERKRLRWEDVDEGSSVEI